MRVRIETERLILRNLVPEDAESAFEWCKDPEALDGSATFLAKLFRRDFD